MADDKTRRLIAHRAAWLMYERLETEYFTAKRKAARQLGVAYKFKPGDLPTNAEIRDHIQQLARIHEGEARTRNLRDMRLAALRLMRRLARYRPRLIGSVLTGHIRSGSDIDLHLFSDSLAAVRNTLDDLGLPHDVEHKRIRKHNEERTFVHIHLRDGFDFELTLYPEDKVNHVFRSSITGGPIERADIAELEKLLRDEHPDVDLEHELSQPREHVDPFALFAILLAPLEAVKQNPVHHPEGDALYHSLQVFERAKEARPWDEEFLLAALLHDVGKAIDPADHVGAALEALEGSITPRTRFLIEHHMDALAYRAGTLGERAARRLERHEDFDDLMLLRDCDDAGRVRGAEVGTIAAALDYIRSLPEEPYLS
jgi:hypothetical protein